ncbi:MAG TPA: hypothetical protein VFP97_17705 [Chitinophagaceae bacterium]|nr:hypothetical protein [Chitinophagaceae bacterium]
MDREFEQLSVNFNTKAQKVFTSIYEKFRLSVKKLDRQKDENVFQLQMGKYLNTLKSELEGVAYELLTSHKSIRNTDLCNKVLKDYINIYLQEFRQKARLL